MKPATTFAAGAAFVLALTAHFAFETLAGSGTADAGAVVVGAPVAALVICLVSGIPSRRSLAGLAVRDWLLLGGAGAAAFVVAPYLVLANRYSSAPSGAESLFFTTSMWGAVLFAAGSIAARTVSWGGLVGAFTALVGNAAMLASWELPSSFSPLVRFAREETLMVVASLGWVALAVALTHYAERVGRRVTLFACACGAALAATALGVVRWSESLVAAQAWTLHVPLGLALGAMAVAWSHLAGRIGTPRAAGTLFAPALLIAVLSGAQYAAARTAQPMLLPQVAAAALVIGVGAAAVLVPPGAVRRSPAEPAAKALAVAGVAVALLAAVALALPALGADVTGRMETGEVFRAAWSMSGAETAGGWIALAAAFWLVWSVLGGGAAAAASGLAVLVAYPWLKDVPLRTWTRWIPGKIQQDYGTEYARLVFAPVSAPVQRAAVGLSAALLAAAAVLAVAGGRGVVKSLAGQDTEVEA